LKPTYGGSKKPCAKKELKVDCRIGFLDDVRNHMLGRK
jgi:hypothetical protein